MNKGIVIAGATGEVGKRLVENLIARNQNNTIIALVRRKNSEFPSQVIQHEVDFNKLNELKLQEHIHMAFCCLGTSIKKAGSKDAFEKVDHEYVVAFAKWSKAQGCEKFACITSVGANRYSKNFYLQVKGKTEHDLTQLNFTHLWLIRPGLLLGDRPEFRLLEYIGAILSRIISPFLMGRLAKYKSIQMITLAHTMANLLDNENSREGCHVLEGKALHSEED